jgi:hypothetical protein
LFTSNSTQFSSRYRKTSRMVYFQRGCKRESSEHSHQNGQLQQLPSSPTGKPQMLVPNVPLLTSQLSIPIPRDMTRDRKPPPAVFLPDEHMYAQCWKSPSILSPYYYGYAVISLPREEFADLRQIVTRRNYCRLSYDVIIFTSPSRASARSLCSKLIVTIVLAPLQP